MPAGSIWPVPYFLDPTHLAFDELVSFCVSILVAVMINAEGQAYLATFLGDYRPGAKDRLHFNVFLHLDILGTICYFVGGFGWPRKIEIDSSKFKYPRLFTGISRFSGALANLLMSSIAASIAMLIKLFLDLDSPVFMMLIGVNITTAIYNLLPIPPLAAGTLVQILLPQRFARMARYFGQAGPFLILALALGERLTHKAFFSSFLNPLVLAVFNFLTR